jgi:hypothetical protein
MTFWATGTSSGRHFDAEVATGHHDAVAEVEDRTQHLQGLGLLDLGQHGGAAFDDAAQLGHVFRGLHERQGDPVDAQAQGEGQVLAVLGRQGRHRDDDVRHRHALALRQLAAVDDCGVGIARTRVGHGHAQLAVVQQQGRARPHGGQDLGVRQVHARLVARRRVAVEAEGLAGLQHHRAVGELADAQLGTLQVGQDAQRTADDLLGLADRRIDGRVGLVRAVAEVQAADQHRHVAGGLARQVDRRAVDGQHALPRPGTPGGRSPGPRRRPP